MYFCASDQSGRIFCYDILWCTWSTVAGTGEKQIKEKLAEIQESSNHKYQAKAVPKAALDEEPAQAPAKQTRAAARAKLDIAVEDDED